MHLSQELRNAEAQVEAHSHALKKELGLRDLVLTQILFIVGLPWVGVAAMFYALTYLVMFALPLFGLRGVEPRPPVWLRLATASGLGMTSLNVVFAVFPIVQVESRWFFAAKILVVIGGANLLGAAVFLLAAKKRRRVG
jgi:hypothetical protein